MYIWRIAARRFLRVLPVFLALIGVVSAAMLLSGGVGAAQNFSRPNLSAQGELISTYPAIGTNDVTYHGGSVLRNPKVFLVFEGSWADSDVQTVKQYFIDVSGSAFEAILGQYPDSSGSISNTITISGSVIDPNPIHSDSCGTNSIIDSGVPPAPLAGDTDIWNELYRETQGAHDASTIYFVFTPPGYSVYGVVTDSSCTKLACGYHNNFPGSYIYAVIAWGGGPCGTTDGSAIDTVVNTAAHEQFEAITNPAWTLTEQSGTGWYNNDQCAPGIDCKIGGEIGDKCANEHPGIYLNGHMYNGVQGVYSNATHECYYTVPPPPTPTPTPTKPPTCSATTETDNITVGTSFTDNRGNTWYVYYDIKRDTLTNLPCQMRVVVRIFNPPPNGAWSGTTAVFAYKNGAYLSGAFGKVSGSCTFQAHFVWRGPWFSASTGSYYIQDSEYNGSNPYTRAYGSFTL